MLDESLKVPDAALKMSGRKNERHKAELVDLAGVVLRD
jgi:hypothetical protein